MRRRGSICPGGPLGRAFVRATVGVMLLLLPFLALSAQQGNGEVTLWVFDGRPLENAAQTLARDYGIRVSVEDPLYFWESDLVESHRTSAGKRVMVPKPLLLETSFHVGNDGQPDNVPALLDALIDRMSLERPFHYRITPAPEGYNIVPTAMRNERGELVPYASPLDTPVSIPQATRTIVAHTRLIIEQVIARTATDLGCCTPGASNIDSTPVAFGADNEPARNALQRLLLMRPARAKPSLQNMRCQPLERSCVVNWTPIQ